MDHGINTIDKLVDQKKILPPRPKNDTATASTQKIGRSSLIKGLAGAGLLGILNSHCSADDQNGANIPNNFLDLRKINPLPTDERGRTYEECPPLTLEHAAKFFEEMKQFFPLDIAKLINIFQHTSGEIRFGRKFSTIELKAEVERQLSTTSDNYQIISCHSGDNYLTLQFTIGGIAYTLVQKNTYTLQLSINNNEKNVNLFSNALALRSASMEKDRYDLELLQTGMGTTAINTGDGNLHVDTDTDSFDVFNTESLLNLMRKNKDKSLFSLDHRIFPESTCEDISSIDQVIEMIKQLPHDDAKSFIGLYSDFFKYAARDSKPEDTYKNPIETLKSHWGDCDDFSQINGLWAKLNGYRVEFIYLDPKPTAEEKTGHVLVYCQKSGKTLILDNDVLTLDMALDQYLERYKDLYLSDRFLMEQ